MVDLTPRISIGNHKLGEIPSISLPPVKTCNRCAGCSRRQKGRKLPPCYAIRMLARRPNIAKSWAHNLAAWKADPAEYFTRLGGWLQWNRPRYFRFHIGGDCPSFEYLRDVVRLANALPETRFMLFTKRYEWLSPYMLLDRILLPANLAIIASAWPGLDLPDRVRRSFPVAWMRDARNADPRIPADAIECPGNCQACTRCWSLKPGQSVVFNRH